jgi:manganese transport protein
MSNLMALLYKARDWCIVTQRDLHKHHERPILLLSIIFYILADCYACDLAEGSMAMGLNLLFCISLIDGVIITVLDTFCCYF